MNRTQKPLLIAFLGSIGVGKSYFAKQLAPRIGAVRLSADAARLGMFGSIEALKSQPESHGLDNNKRLFGVIDYAVGEILSSGVSVIYDTARYNGADNRRELKRIADAHDAHLVYVWIDTPRDIVRERVMNREETADQRRLDETATNRILAFHDEHFNPPNGDEMVIKINGQDEFEDQYKDFSVQLEQGVAANE